VFAILVGVKVTLQVDVFELAVTSVQGFPEKLPAVPAPQLTKVEVP
jgi:hypothetical protein